MVTTTLEYYGWVALALPVYANVSWDPGKALEQARPHWQSQWPPSQERNISICITKLPENHLSA